MWEQVILLGGSSVGAGFPAVLYPYRELEENRYQVTSVLTMEDGFDEDGMYQEERLQELLEEDDFHLVGYCAGGNAGVAVS